MNKILTLIIFLLYQANQALPKRLNLWSLHKCRFLLYTILFVIFSNNSYSQYHWNKINLPDSVKLWSICFNDDVVYLGTDKGAYVSDINFNNFEFIGLENSTVGNMISTSNDLLLAGAGGLWKYDSGTTWTKLLDVGQSITCFHESPNGNLFFGSWGYIYRSTDDGNTWHQVWDSGHAHGVNQITENSEGVLFAGTRSYGSDTCGLFKSIDNGETWNLISLDDQFVYSVACNYLDTLYVGYDNFSNSGIYKSDDTSGYYWTSIFDNNLVYDLEISNEYILIAGCSTDGYPGGVYISYNNGDSWEDISGDLPSRNTDIIILDFNDYLYKSDFWSGELYRLSDPITGYHSNISRDIDFKITNPVIDKLTIYFPKKANYEISVFDISGKIKLNITLPNQELKQILDINGLKAGNYIIEVINDKKRSSEKFTIIN